MTEVYILHQGMCIFKNLTDKMHMHISLCIQTFSCESTQSFMHLTLTQYKHLFFHHCILKLKQTTVETKALVSLEDFFNSVKRRNPSYESKQKIKIKVGCCFCIDIQLFNSTMNAWICNVELTFFLCYIRLLLLVNPRLALLQTRIHNSIPYAHT